MIDKLESCFYKTGPQRRKTFSASGLKAKTEALIQILRENPYQITPPYEKLIGDLAGAYSRRINIHYRLVYQILDEDKTVKVIRMWTHCE